MANQDKLSCMVCHSTFFYTEHAEQFQAGGYGSAQFRSLSNAPKTILVCIGCGAPVTPMPTYYGKNTTADVAEQDFRKSVEAGQKYRKAQSIQNIAQISVSPEELKEVRDIVNGIVHTLDTPAKPKVSKSKAKAVPVSGD